MPMFVISLVLCGAIFAYLLRLTLLAAKREQIRPVPVTRHGIWPFVSVIVPARNEEHNITTVLGGLNRQTYPRDRFEVIVVDDFSTDRTRDCVAAMAQEADIHIRCIPGRELPEGWLGKSNACMAGALEARGEWLYFMDADTFSEPDMLTATIDFAMGKGCDLLSFNPRQEMTTLAEKTLLPGLFLAIASLMRFDRSNDPRHPDAIANGQAMLFKKEAYDAVGGHGVVAGEMSEDFAFAKAMKTRGFKIYWAFGDHIMATRMYTGAREIWNGFSKNMNRIMACTTILQVAKESGRTLFLAWANPLFLVVAVIMMGGTESTLHTAAVVISLVTQTVLFITYMVLANQLFIPAAYGVLAPLGLTLQSCLVVRAYRLSKSNKLTWKGRKI